MLSSEKAFDMLPYVSDIYEKVNIQKYVLDNKRKGDTKDKLAIMGFGLDMFSYIMKQSPKVKTEIFTIVSMIEGKDIKEVKAQPFTQTLKTFKDLFEDKDTIDFFKSAMQ